MSDHIGQPKNIDQAWSHRDDEGAEWLLVRLASPLNNPLPRCQLIRGCYPELRKVADGKLSVTFGWAKA